MCQLNKLRVKTLFLTCLAGAFFLYFILATPVLAQTANPGNADQNYGLGTNAGFQDIGVSKNSDLKSIVVNVINITLGFLGVVAVIIIMYAGFLWMTARGNEDQIKKAKLFLRNAVIGLVIILSAWGIVSFVIKQILDSENNAINNTSSDGGGDNFGGLGSEKFTLKEIQTGHAGATTRDDVYRCSLVQPRFNHWLQSPLNAAARVGIKAVRTKDNITNTVINENLAMAVGKIDNVNILRLERRDNTDPTKKTDWPANSQIEIQVPKSITDYNGESLRDCTALGCNDRDTYYAWSFTTTDKKDEISPNLKSAYPGLPGTPAGYPDRNVDRSITFTLNFSEAIDSTTVVQENGRLIQDNIKIEKITSATDSEAGEIIPVDHFDATFSETGVQFKLNKTHQSAAKDGPYLDPFTWYRITIKGIKDLCGNSLTSTMAGNEVVWIFQTNGNVPGVAFTYPAGGYKFACPNTEIFVQFKTSMFDVKNNSCAVSTTIGGLVKEGWGVPGRNLVVHDPVPTSGNPNDFCKRYDFAPVATELEPNKTYGPGVSYQNPANDTQNNRDIWSFDVKPAGQCVNTPYISRIDPGTGPFGRCITIYGNYFGATKTAADDAYMTLDLESAGNNISADAASQVIRSAWTELNNGNGVSADINSSNWFDTYLTGVVPKPVDSVPLPVGTNGMADFKFFIKHIVTLGGTEQVLKSNEVSFRAQLVGSYNGPCLSGISPTVGAWGAGVTLAGINFGSSQSSGSFVKFSNNSLETNISSWQGTRIQTIVPNNGTDGLVHVTTSQGISNGLPFDVANGAGGSCSTSNDCATGLTCSVGICVSIVGTNKFEIKNPQPSASCIDSCANATISFETTKNIRPDTVNANNIKIKKCNNSSCVEGVDIPPGIVIPTTLVNRVEISNELNKDTWYQISISGLITPNGEQMSPTAYSWKFKTGVNDCGVEKINLSPTGGILYSGSNSQYQARAYSISNSCASNGQQIIGNFSWRDAIRTTSGTAQSECIETGNDEIKISLNPVVSTATSTVTVSSFDSGDRIEHLAWICVRSGDKIAGSAITLKPRCTSDNDCKIEGCAATCNQQTKICNPKIIDFNPKNGAPGTWTIIDGCYLGNDWGEVKINNTNAIAPDVNFCGNTWSNTQVVAAVAPGTSSGIVQVKRIGDGLVANAADNFGINSNIGLGLCRINPEYGKSGSEVKLFGINFGSTRVPERDKVFFNNTEALDVKSWTDTGVGSIIQVVVPNMATGTVSVKVKKERLETGSIDFRVIDSSGSASNDDIPQDLKIFSYAPTNAACPSAIIEVILDGLVSKDSLKIGSVTPDMPLNNFYVRSSADASHQLEGEINLQYIDGSKTRLTFVPKNNLTFGTGYEIILKSGETGLRSLSNGKLIANDKCSQTQINNGKCSKTFETKLDTDQTRNDCQPNSLIVEPINPIFTCAGKNDCSGDKDNSISGNQQQFITRTLAKIGDPIVWRDGYNWINSDNSILNFSDGASSSNAYARIMTVQPKNGSSVIKAQAVNTNVFGSTLAQVFLCENPWPTPVDGFFSSFKDDSERAGAIGIMTEFSTFYCRDKGVSGPSDDLPNMSLQVEIDRNGNDNKGEKHSVMPDLLKELFFIVPRAGTQRTDAIGIRVLQDTEHYSVGKWYNKQTFPKGSPSSIVIDGYQALQDGRTVYVVAPADVDGDVAAGANKIFTNVYLLSISDNPAIETQEIFNQLLANWRFAINVLSPENREALRRDVTRITDLQAMADVIKSRSRPPTLISGSFKPGLSISAWPSWKGTLSLDLGSSLPIDPINKVLPTACSVGAPASCFDDSKALKCENGSYVYQYQYSSTVPNFTLKANLEYQASSWNHQGTSWSNIIGNNCANIKYSN